MKQNVIERKQHTTAEIFAKASPILEDSESADQRFVGGKVSWHLASETWSRK